ncbi:zinc finger MYM-type protein 6-like [Aphis gossypii]|uniref:zinc finger MYM-type protein 6-like n=1 Tax=Aphis gossypii TaxID=80765 RepID=UPI002158D949|nr:zinc finger MYM-type protein 6-like [Aphis gossypii]
MSITLSEKAKSKKGRGSLITFMSKNFINNNIIIPIGAAIQGTIVKEIKECIKFSIMIDSTQDVSVMDQLAICVRYIFNGVVQERLLSLVVCHNSSGIGLFNLLKEEIKKLGLMLNDIVACSFDGAANMKGIYNGLQAHLKSVNPNIVYTHCMGHVLNLVICSTDINLAEDLFGLVEQSAVFLSDSHKRMETWTSITSVKHTGHDKLYKLQKIGATWWWSKDKALSSVMDLQLNIVEIDKEVDNAKFTTLLTFLTTVCHGNFNSQSKFIAKSLINTIQNSIETRFMKNANLLKDLNWLDPRSFAVFNNIELLPVSALSTLSKISGLNHEIILTELKQFSNQYENFLIPKYTTDCDSENKLLLRNEDASDEDNDEISKSVNCNKCNKCIHCAFLIVRELSCQSNLFVIYKFALLLPSTQTTCERVFSKLKCIKTKLRSTLHQNHLTPLMLMAIEKNIAIDTQQSDVTKAVQHWKNTKDTNKAQKIKGIQQDLANALFHRLGQHTNCDSYFCNNSNLQNTLNLVPEAENNGIMSEIQNIMSRLITNAESLLENKNNNICEQFNSIINKYTAGKRINFQGEEATIQELKPL